MSHSCCVSRFEHRIHIQKPTSRLSGKALATILSCDQSFIFSRQKTNAPSKEKKWVPTCSRLQLVSPPRFPPLGRSPNQLRESAWEKKNMFDVWVGAVFSSKKKVDPPYTLLGTNISPPKAPLKMIFLLPKWDMLVPGRGIPRNYLQILFQPS